MNETYITTELLAQYAQQLYEEEKSSATIEKYIRDVRTFSKYAGSQALTKDLTIAYKRDLPTRGYTILSVNSMLASLNSFLVFCGRADCKVKLYRVQKKTYLAANRELSKAEYLRLLHAARKDQRLWLLLQTLCATGIRVSELQYFTVEAVQAGEISVACKNKTRSIRRNWLIGYRISEEELSGENRAEYGASVIARLSKELSKEYGKGFTKTNLYSFYSFYKTYPQIFQTPSGKSQPSLTWSHYAVLLQVPDSTAREWYAKEADEQMWSVRTLQRNISSQYYYRMLQTQKPELVESEMRAKTFAYAERKLEFIKNPVVAEFLGLSGDATFTETDLETSIISNLQKFLMELGKGYAFVARQQHIRTEKQDYYIDLVFYNYILKCFVLIDLKTEKITHQDVGQMDMYIRMYDELKRSEGDNPTIGIVLCSDTDADIARYSILNGNEQLFATKYKLYLPTEEELRAEIETQKAIFYLQQQKGKDADL